MSLSLRLGVCLALLCLLGPATPAAVFTVHPDGPIPTINEALFAAGDGDTILIVAATDYVEEVLYVWHHGLTIEGVTGAPTLARTRFLITGAGLTMRNLILDGQNDPETVNLLHFLGGAEGATIEDCTLVNPGSGSGDGEIGDLAAQNDPSHYNASSSAIRMAGSVNMTFLRCDFGSTRNDAVVNQVNILSYAFARPGANFRIEGCAFQAQTRNIVLIDSHDDVVVRDCDFDRVGGADGDRLGLSSLSASAICILPTTGERPSLFRNIRIEDNRFNSVSGVGLLFYNGRVENAVVLRNRFQDCFGPNLVVKCGGDQLLAAGNAFHRPPAPPAPGGVVETAPAQLGDALEQLALMDNHFLAAPESFVLARAGATRQRLERNLFESAPGSCWRTESNAPRLEFVDNLVLGGGGAASAGALALASDGQLVRRNRFLDHRGAVAFLRFGLPGFPEAALPAGRNLVAENIIARMDAFGIREESSLFASNRYFNNTIVSVSGTAVSVQSNQVDVFNNIITQCDAGIELSGATGGVRDFNLLFDNGPAGDRHYLGLAVPGRYDIHLDPRFLDAAAGDFRLAVFSPARNAGTSPIGRLTEPDGYTELGALQDAFIDTRVPRRGWERYR